MKKILYSILIILVICIIIGCSYNITFNNKKEIIKDNNSKQVIKQVEVIINGNKYKVNIEDNETARSFVKLLPQEFNMSELNGNEKYIYLDTNLPTDSSNPHNIKAGDLMLYGDNCLVIFYKSFNTSYRYSRIGYIENLPNLGDDNVLVKFENLQ